jgi:hypothetical protein
MACALGSRRAKGTQRIAVGPIAFSALAGAVRLPMRRMEHW